MSEYNAWGVSYSAISFFERALQGHDRVASVSRSNDIVFTITTKGMTLNVLLVNEYVLGLEAVLRAKKEFPEIEYIVTCANWNGYTFEAKEHGNKNGIGIFVAGEFFGALHYTHPKSYVKKSQDGKPLYYYKSA